MKIFDVADSEGSGHQENTNLSRASVSEAIEFVVACTHMYIHTHGEISEISESLLKDTLCHFETKFCPPDDD
jgi:hypothetical protein